MALTVERLKRTRPAQLLKQYVWHPYLLRNEPRVSVVVPFHDSRRHLTTSLESLLRQNARKLEILLVDDGSTDGSRAIADRYAAAHRHIRVLEQEHRGAGAARNLGAAAATGDYLVFCDSDDIVVSTGYERLVEALESSGSDLAVGSVATEVKGRFELPEWAYRSNPVRTMAVALEDAPHVLGNLILGARMVRRSFWTEHGFAFADDERGDLALMVSSLLAAERVDILPAVVYRWSWREDNRSLLQQDLRDRDRVARRVCAVRDAGRLLVVRGSERVQQHYFAEVLHTVIADLVRAAVCREDGYWEALASELHELMAGMSAETLASVPVEDRIIAWLCANDERAAAEEFLEYAFDNRSGYPFRATEGRPHIDLPFIDALVAAPPELKRVAEVDMRLCTRLVRVGWTDGGLLRLAGGAFAEYLDDRSGDSDITVVLVERVSGHEVRVPAAHQGDVTVNQWASRASEDHHAAGFEALVDVRRLPAATTERTVFDIVVELRLGGFEFRGPFRSRNVSASAGLLEPWGVAGFTARPTWRDHRGLGLVTRPDGPPAPRAAPQPELAVETVEARNDVLRLEGRASSHVELALTGPRGSSEWCAATRSGSRFSVDLPVVTDEWGLGGTTLPADTYVLRARYADGRVEPVACDRRLWRSLPRPVDSCTCSFVPMVHSDGTLRIRLTPVEWQVSRPALLRRRLRDDTYPAAKQEPLLDAVLFETFAGKGTGDNPGAILAQLHDRDVALDLVYSVIDRSNVVPDGARAVVRWSPEWFELLGRARYLIVNASLPYFFRKRPGQLYYQTWHGTPLKRIAHDRPHLDFFNWHHRRQLLVARDGWDWLLSQSPFCTEALSSAFRYTGPVMEVGYPRNDVLRSSRRHEVRRRTRAHFGLRDDTLTVLYAPTWRDNLRVGAVFNKVLYLDPAQLVDSIEDSAVLVRGHYNSVGAADRRGEDDRILDVTRYPDIADLYLAADVLVTDYSSVFFDFSLTDKPMVFLAPDLAEYRDDNRGFYLDYHDVVPGPVCLSTAEVVGAITAPDRFAQARADFRRRFNPFDDGAAAARVVDGILASFPPAGSGPSADRGQ